MRMLPGLLSARYWLSPEPHWFTPSSWVSALQSPRPSAAGFAQHENIFAKRPVIPCAKPGKTPTLEISHYEPFCFFLSSLPLFFSSGGQSCYVSRNRLWTPDPAASALGAGIKVAGGIHNTLGLTMKCQARMNLEILGKKGPQFHRSLHLLTKYTKVNTTLCPSGYPPFWVVWDCCCKATTQREHAEPLLSQARYFLKFKTKQKTNHSDLGIDKIVCM